MKRISTLMLVLMALLALPLTASADEAVFDFENNPNNWPVGEGTDFAAGNLTAPLVIGEVTLTGVQGDATQPVRIMRANDGISALYVYKNGTIKFNAAEGKALTKIEVTMKSNNFDLAASTGAVADNVWTGNASEVAFTSSATRQMKKIVVTTAAEDAETVKPKEESFDVEAANIAAFNAIEDGKVVKLTLKDARVNGIFNNAYVEDASGATVFKGLTLTAGTALDGYVIGTKYTNKDIDYSSYEPAPYEPQLIATDATTFKVQTTTLAGTVMSLVDACKQANYGRLITLENITITGSGQNKTLTDASGNTMKARDYMGVLPAGYTWPEKASKITGVIIYYMTGWFLMPISADAIAVAGEQPTSVTFNFSDGSLMTPGTKLTDPVGFIFNKTFTKENVALQITAGSAQSAIYTDSGRGTCLAMFPMYATMGITAPEGYAFTQIDFIQAGSGDLNMTPIVGTVTDHTWTGNADVVYFTMPQQQGTAYLSKVTVTLAAKNNETVSATIDYTSCANIAAFNALEDGTPAKVTLTDAEVTGISANGYGTAWIQDATGGCLIQYSSLIEGLQEKTKLNGVVYVIIRKNSGNSQMKDAIDTPKSEIEATPISDYTMIEGTLAEVNIPANLNKVVKITGASFVATSATAGTLKQGDATIDVSNGTATANQQLHKITDTWVKNETSMDNVTIVAILTGKSSTANQLLPISMTSATDGISTINKERGENAVIYNLQGVRLNSLQKGINIVNGKKVVIK